MDFGFGPQTVWILAGFMLIRQPVSLWWRQKCVLPLGIEPCRWPTTVLAKRTAFKWSTCA